MKFEVYDKAKWHYDSKDMPKDLPAIAGATHIAFFVRCYHSDKTKFAKKFGYYLADYDNWVKNKLGSQYNPDTSYFYVENSEENYNEIKEICNKRYSEFLKG